MCGESTTTQNQQSASTGSTILPAWATAAGENIFNSANAYAGANPYQAYSGPTQGSFGNEWNTAANYATGQLGKDNPGLTGSSDALKAVLGAAMPTATGSIQSGMSPYISGVLQPTLDAIGRDAASRNNSTAANATMSGAFGDSGFGVQKALDNDNTQRNISNATAGAYDKAFSDASANKNSALQQIMGAASGLSGNASAQFGQNQQLTQLLSQMGLGEQGANAQGVTNQMTVNNQKNSGQLNQFATLDAILRGAPMDTITTNIGSQTSGTTRPDNSGMALAGSLAGGLLS
jgi:hypothetical protein